ncbi:hypothetical protein HMPREF3086_01560 [Dietzia sp. HMSC21D01]|jgi:hypothetical protein|uniref:Uncharacterized protein n=1 Tax=Dietzia cinnamea TaxID=321318 RepID=A0AAW5Q654_9ACTN|nr:MULTISPECIES: hypothetical protein [Dietzia]MCT1862816.1 hypothetical protein [Dietzia cinnamea]MCT2028570.1 hypothetical protein [Dietzia cinnamea]MCT2032093.1 hypothetical protein [Dietzia cinnamea]MCT2075003.1 hypothetical protein [Dietzia cinnamea]MCT2104954.1 hypothetical protein [Dietzia cinnamea]
MSGPKGIEYEIQQARFREERALADAQAGWRRLTAAVRRFRIGCEVTGHTDLFVELPVTPTGDSAPWRRACEQVRQRLERSQAEFDRRRQEELHRRVEHDISAAVAELKRSEAIRIAAALDAARAHAAEVETSSTVSDAVTDRGPTREDVRKSVDAELRRLTEHSPELTSLGALIIAEDPRRSRLLVADLAGRVSAANRVAATRREYARTIDDLRAKAESIAAEAGVVGGSDPSLYLDRAETTIAAGGDPAADLRTASDIVVGLERLAATGSERRFVMRAVTESLAELGYTVHGTEVGTAETLLFRSSAAATDTHLVRVEVDGEEVGIRTVRTSGSTTRLQDMAADESLCADLDPFLAGLSDRGVTSGRIRRTEAGVVSPPVVAVRESGAGTRGEATAATTDAAAAARRRRARTTRQQQGGTR